MDFRRDENNFGVELVRRVVSQVGVVNTGEQLPGSVLLFPPDNKTVLCVALQTPLNCASEQVPRKPKVPRRQRSRHDDFIVRVLAHSPIRACTRLVG